MGSLADRVLNVAEAAAYIGVSERTLYAAISREEFPHRRIGRRVVVPGAALARWLEGEDVVPLVEERGVGLVAIAGVGDGERSS